MNINVGSRGSRHLVSGYIGSTSVYIPNTYTSLCVCVRKAAEHCARSVIFGVFLGSFSFLGPLLGPFLCTHFDLGLNTPGCVCVCVSILNIMLALFTDLCFYWQIVAPSFKVVATS